MSAPHPTSAHGRKAPATGPVPATDPSTVTAARDSADAGLAGPPVIAGLRVVRRLGGGGMGDVYEVIDERLDLRFALKTIRPDRVGGSFRERFRQEMRAMLSIRHPHVARIYKHDEVDGWPYFTMEYAPNGTLADHRDAYRADPRAAARLMAKVADAVDYLHRQGKVHRDLKPSNVLIDAHGEPLVSDFGLVKDVADLDSNTLPGVGQAGSTPPTAREETGSIRSPVDPAGVTRTGGVVGTAAYMAPEQARAEKGAVGRAADVWALGVILYELVVGYRPADAPDPDNSLVDLARIDPDLAQIVGRCLAPEPVGRYGTAAALSADLRHWADPARPPPAPQRRARRMGFAIGLLTLTALAVLLAVRPWTRDREKPPSTLEQLRQEMRDRLAAGQTVTLIDADGNAAPLFRYLAGETHAKAERDPAGGWLVTTSDAALIEFLDDTGIDSYRLVGQVRCDNRKDVATARLFAAHRRVADPTGTWDFRFEYGYREAERNFAPPALPAGLPPPAAAGGKKFLPVEIRARPGPPGERSVRIVGTAAPTGASRPVLLEAWTIASDRPVEGGPWRTLEISVAGTAFSTRWEGEPDHSVQQLLPPQLVDVQRLLRARPDPPLTFAARGGLGVAVEGGSAAFRDLRILPGTTP